jgi:hypothetical protein
MNTEAAAARDTELKPILETRELSYREIAEELTSRKIPTPRGEVGNRGQVKEGQAWSKRRP